MVGVVVDEDGDDKSDISTSLACLAITATSLGSSLPVKAPITAPITGWSGLTYQRIIIKTRRSRRRTLTVSLLSIPLLVPPATARKSLSPR